MLRLASLIDNVSIILKQLLSIGHILILLTCHKLLQIILSLMYLNLHLLLLLYIFLKHYWLIEFIYSHRHMSMYTAVHNNCKN